MNEYDQWTQDLLDGKPTGPRLARVEERYHAPSPPMSPSLRSYVHLHVLDAVERGRYKRAAGECLCGKKRGSNERPPRGNAIRCEACNVRAIRLGLEWPSASTKQQRSAD